MMQILSIRPAAGASTLAVFDVELTPHLRLFNMVLKRGPDGCPRTYAPKVSGKHAASFHPELAQQITNAAAAAFKERAAYDRNAA